MYTYTSYTSQRTNAVRLYNRGRVLNDINDMGRLAEAEEVWIFNIPVHMQ